MRIALVGHCGPDMSYLMLLVKSAAPGATIERINTGSSLQTFTKLAGGLLLVNRVLDGDFSDDDGIGLIERTLSAGGVRAMLISNYEDAQAAAVRAGALPGFGKRDIGSAKARQALAAAIEAADSRR
jgi:hypothetical protein